MVPNEMIFVPIDVIITILVTNAILALRMTHEMLEAIRSKVGKETQKHQYGNALFWADKAISLGGGLLIFAILAIY